MSMLLRIEPLLSLGRARLPAWFLLRLGRLCGPVRGLLASAGLAPEHDEPFSVVVADSTAPASQAARTMEAGRRTEPTDSAQQDQDDTLVHDAEPDQDDELDLDQALARALHHLGEAAEYVAGILDLADELDDRAKSDLIDACRYFAEVHDYLEEQ